MRYLEGTEKYIFLDIDGPLCTHRSLVKAWAEYFKIDYSKFNLLDSSDLDELRDQIRPLRTEKREKGEELPDFNCENWPFDEEAVQNLNTITDATGAKIVICSSHRIGRTLYELQEQLSRQGVTGEVVAMTPVFRNDQLITPYRRGEEILAWISQETKPMAMSGMIIIDDSYADIEPIWGKFLINIYHGMSNGGY